MKQNAGFDPFSPDQTRARVTRSWLIATGLQALLTCVLLAASHWANGKPYEMHARAIVCLGIVATWSLALRTIRERLLELLAFWQKASLMLIKKASESGLHFVNVPMKPAHELYIRGSIRRLRIIAAGLTIPFFAMPLMWTFIAVFLSFHPRGASAEDWVSAACFMLFSALIVAGYFHWAIVPLPHPVRVRAAGRTRWRRR